MTCKMKTIAFILSIMLTQPCLSQVVKLDTLLYNGAIDKLINLVILGDGYQSTELIGFKSDANKVMNYFFSQSPFTQYKNYFNIFAIEVKSNESGAKHPHSASDCPPLSNQPISVVDNYFGSTFDDGGLHRLLSPTNYSRISDALSGYFPQYDLAFIIVNSPYYGGSGGEEAVSSINSLEIPLHEIGHSFGGLEDEYWSGFSQEAPNMTQESNPSIIKWKNWLNKKGIGIYPFSEAPSWYKPHNSCKMQYLGSPFCSVCAETVIEKIHDLVNPIYSYSPSLLNFSVKDNFVVFKLNIIKPISNTLSLKWKLDGGLYAQSIDSLRLNVLSLPVGNHVVSVSVIDTTMLTKSDSHPSLHLYTVTWNINKTPAGVDLQPLTNHLLFQVYPNPISFETMLHYRIEEPAYIYVRLLDINGRIIAELAKKEMKTAGEYTLALDKYLQQFPSGDYLIEMNLEEHSFISKIIK